MVARVSGTAGSGWSAAGRSRPAPGPDPPRRARAGWARPGASGPGRILHADPDHGTLTLLALLEALGRELVVRVELEGPLEERLRGGRRTLGECLAAQIGQLLGQRRIIVGEGGDAGQQQAATDRKPAPRHSRAVRDMFGALQQKEMTGTRTGSGARCSLIINVRNGILSHKPTAGDSPRLAPDLKAGRTGLRPCAVLDERDAARRSSMSCSRVSDRPARPTAMGSVSSKFIMPHSSRGG